MYDPIPFPNIDNPTDEQLRETYNKIYHDLLRTIQSHNYIIDDLRYTTEQFNKYKAEANELFINIVKLVSKVRGMVRRNKIDIEPFNELITHMRNLNYFSDASLLTIDKESMYSVKAEIILEGSMISAFDPSDVNKIKHAIIDNIQNNGRNGNTITINHVEVQDMYDIEGLTTTEEG